MTKKKEVAVRKVPELRFPEFRDAQGWEERRLGEMGSFLPALSGKSGEDFNNGEANYITYMNVFQNVFTSLDGLGRVKVAAGERQNKVQKGDLFFTISSETPEEVGMSSVLLDDLENCYLNSFCALFRFSKEVQFDLFFAGYLFRQKTIRDYFSKHCQGSTRFNLSKEIFRKLPVSFPSIEEQQKIANCLFSFDELIATQIEKIEAVKLHKQKLVRHFFPAEDETVPHLRFPEFHGSPEWTTSFLGKVSVITSGGTPSRSKAHFWNGNIPWVTTSLIDFNVINEANEHITLEPLAKVTERQFVVDADRRKRRFL